MVILHVTAPAEVGGLERVVEGLAVGQRRSGHEVHVAAALHERSSAPAFLTSLQEEGVQVHPRRLPARAYLQERRGIAELSRDLAPAVVHSHGLRADVLTAVAAGPLGVPLISTVHGYIPGAARERAMEWIHTRALRRFGAVAAVSRPLMDRLGRAGIQPDRLHLVPNAWTPAGPPLLPAEPARTELRVPDGSLHLGWVGRLTAEKGPDTFVEALGLTADLPVTASMLGDGHLQPGLEARARELGIADRIRWLGVVPAASRLFRGFDAFVLTSRTEGTPIVLFEAMAAGVPIVTTAVGGIPDMLSPSEAILVPPEDPASLARAIRQLRDEDASVGRKRTEAARIRLHERFGAAGWIARYEEIYRSLCRHRAASRPSDEGARCGP